MTKNINKVIIILGIVLLGMILRSPITSVGAISGPLKGILNINNTVVGLITTIPLIAFALCSPVVSKFSGKLGLEKTVFYSALIIAIGLGLRFYLNTYMFFTATFAAFAAGISYPIASSNIGGTEFSIGLAVNIWIVIAILNAIVYLYISRKSTVENVVTEKSEGIRHYLGSLKMWTLTLSMGLQSALFYCSVSWFSEIMISKGFSPEAAGLLLSISQFAQFPSTFLVPIFADKLKNKLIIPICIVIGYIGSLLGMVYVHGNFTLMAILVIIFALSGGGSFSYVMYLFSAKARNEKESANISGLAQSGGYLLAAIFPPLLGYIRDISNWDVAIYILIITSVALLVTLIHCSSDGNIIED